MKKRHVKLMAAVMASVMLLTGCGGSGGAETQDESSNGTEAAAATQEEGGNWESDPVLNEPGVEPIVKEPVTLRVVTGYDDWDENWAIQQIKERLGVDFEWIVMPPEQFKEKVNLLLAGGESIDLILFPLGAGSNQKLSKAEEFKLAQQGLLTPLNDYIEYSSKYIKEYYDANPNMYQETTTPDGNMYSFQSHSPAVHTTMPYKLWINTVWLDNLGLEMPTTTEEFYEVLKAFKEQDANGNGDPNDEIPLSTCTSGAGTQIDGFIMNAFTYNDPANVNAKRMRVNDDGQVEASFTDEAYREGLRFLNRLYEEGLLYPDSFTQDAKTQRALNEAGDQPRIGCLLSQGMGYLVSSLVDSTRWHEYEALMPLEGPEGVQLSPRVHSASHVDAPNGLIPTSAEHPEVAFRLLDMLFSEEWVEITSYGEEGVDWRKAEEGELGVDGEPAEITYLTASDVREKKTIWSSVPYPEKAHTGVTAEQNPKAPEGKGHEYILYQATAKMSEYAVDEKNVLPLFYYLPEENEKIATYSVTIDTYVGESIARFISGDLDLDSDWDTYIEELNSFGLQDYIDTIQTGYDRWLANAR